MRWHQAFSAEAASPLPELSIQYTDFAHWQRQRLSGDLLEEQLWYWRQRLQGVQPLQLPTDWPRTDVQSLRAHRTRHGVEAGDRRAQSVQPARRRDAVHAPLLSAFEVLLHRYTGQTDIAIGSPIANRNRTEVEPLIGFFVNSLVLRSDVSGRPRSASCSTGQGTALEAFKHQDVPFEKLVEELRPDRELSQNPLFQIMFALQNAPAEALQLQGLVLDLFGTDLTATRFDIELHVWEQAGGLTAVIFYRTDLFDRSTIARMLSHYQTLLQAAVATPDVPIDALPLLGDAEHLQIVRDWNARTTRFPELPIPQLFEVQAAKTPDAVAVEYGAARLTYRELNERANRLAHALTARGVGPDVLVGLMVERSLDMIVGMLGILKAGGAYVPLDTSYPQNRLALMMADSNVRALLTQEHLLDRVSATRRPCSAWIATGSSSGEPARIRRPVSPPSTWPTSSTRQESTGQPKGAAIPHRGVVRLVCNTDYVSLTSTDRVAQASNASFDAATFEIWGALLHGGCLIGVDKDVALAPVEFATELRDRRITTLFLTTALFNQIAREAPWGFSGLTHLLFGGEAVDPSCVRDVLEKGRPQRLLHVYGPTENTTYSSWHLVDDVPEGATTVPIGGPISYTQLYVLDETLRPVPIGVPVSCLWAAPAWHVRT